MRLPAHSRRRHTAARLAAAVVVGLAATVGLTAAIVPAQGAPTPGTSAYLPPVKHVFVINLEN